MKRIARISLCISLILQDLVYAGLGLFVFSHFLVTPSSLHAASRVMNFQGRLTNASNSPQTGSFDFKFSLHNAVSGGTQLWPAGAGTEDQTLSVVNGVFNAQVGSVTPIPLSVFQVGDGTDVYLEIQVQGETLSPRQRMLAVPYAMTLMGRTTEHFVSTGSVTQVIAGSKTFTNDASFNGTITVPTPSASSQAANKAYVDGLTGGGSNAAVLIATQSFSGQNSFTKHVTVSSSAVISGSVGIGTVSPTGTLHLRSAANYNLLLNPGPTVTNSMGIQALNDAGNANVPLEVRSSLTAFTSGNVSIGSTSAGALLSLGQTVANTKLALFDDGTNFYGFGVQANEFRFHGYSASADFRFYNAPAGSALVTIKGGGNLGVGTIAPSSKFDLLNGSITVRGTSAGLKLQSAASTPLTIETTNTTTDAPGITIQQSNGVGGTVAYDTTNDYLYLRGSSSGGPVLSIPYNSANVGIGTTNPGARLQVGDTANGAADGVIRSGTNNNAGGSRFWEFGAGVANFGNYGFNIRDVSAGIRLTIDYQNGNVGIGSTAPIAKLDVVGGAIKLGITSAPTWDTNGFIWVESGFGSRYDGYQHRFDVGVTRTEAMRIDAAGNMGLGTTTVSAKLNVMAPGDDTSPMIRLFQQSQSAYGFSLGIDNNNTGELYIRGLNNGSESTLPLVLRRDASYVGIGRVPSYNLDIQQTADNQLSGNGIMMRSATSSAYLWNIFAGGDANLYFWSGNTGNYCVMPNATSVNISCTSDRRMKTNIQPLGENALDIVSRLKPSTFDLLKGGPAAGFIAQDVLEVLPGAVLKTQDGYYALSDAYFTPYLVKAVQELTDEKKSLRAELESVKAQNAALERRMEKLERSVPVKK